MKKTLCICAALLLGSLACQGQDNHVFKHFSLSGGLGSTGLTIDMGTMMTHHFGLRAGVDLLGIYLHGYKDYVDLNKKLYLLDPDLEPLPEQKADTHLTNSSGHLLLDYYPFKPSKSGFHVTVGAYLAWHRRVESLENADYGTWRKIADFNARRGDYADVPNELGPATIGYYGYQVPTSAEGSFNAHMRTNRFRPYVGIGFGRAVPGARRLNAQLDLGVQFWGKPRLYNGITGQRLTQVDEKNHGTFGRSRVYPVITIRLAGRIL